MQPQLIDQASRQAGVLPEAFPDVRHRVTAHFADQEDATVEAVQQWLEDTLYPQAAHLWPAAAAAEHPWQVVGVPEAVWHAASPSQKLTWAREEAPPPVKRRPQPLTLTVEQQEEFAALSPQERLTRYRALQADAQP